MIERQSVWNAWVVQFSVRESEEMPGFVLLSIKGFQWLGSKRVPVGVSEF